MKPLTIKEIEHILFNGQHPEKEQLEQLKLDERKGVQILLARFEKQQVKKQQLLDMHKEMRKYEEVLYQQEHAYIAGLDEVGRGPLAGPVVAAAVILPEDFQLLGLTDSKKLSKVKREQFSEVIKKEALAYSIQMIPAPIIDEINIYQATIKAMTNAVADLSIKPSYLLLDAMKLPLPIEQTSLIKGDQKSISIAASSVLAKVARDRYMEELHKKYPSYQFEKNMGYGTAEHLEAIKQHGIISEHRKSFKPVLELAGLETEMVKQDSLF
ncbi:ribonuclease HII [Alkalihalobacillus sp. 1P02AB]|uniref:ribonuclease HII n=1 Tax=Alkalihalobacillus sp. 1P02AB TaxID=3132260 RepID=UPI0039A6C62A